MTYGGYDIWTRLRVNKAEGEAGRCQGGGLGPVSALSEQERVSTGLGKKSSLVLV